VESEYAVATLTKAPSADTLACNVLFNFVPRKEANCCGGRAVIEIQLRELVDWLEVFTSI